MAYQLQEINRRIDQDVKGFLEECDAQYTKRINEAADAIIRGIDCTIANKTVTYDFERLMPGSTKVACSEFGKLIAQNM